MAKITFEDKEMLIENSNIPDKNKVKDTDMNMIKNVVNANETKILIAVSSTAPVQCATGDMYFNTTDNLIYTATGSNTWGTTGIAPTKNTIYLELTNQTVYAYNGTTLISVGGGGGADLPIATIEVYAGSSTDVPDGYLLCDGSAVSRTTYKELFQVIGTTYGTGDGSTTFNLPNIKGKVVVMLDANDTDFDTLGETGGSKYLQEHTHKFNIFSSLGTNGDGGYMGGSAGNRTDLVGNVQGAQTGNSGNLQPYIVLNYIIKVQKTEGEVLSEQLPVGTEVDFDGTSADIPIGWEEVDGKSLVAYDLWDNPNPTSTYGTTPISLETNDCDYFQIIYATNLDETNEINSTGLIPFGKRTRLFYCYTSNVGMGVGQRVILTSSNTQLTLEGGYQQTASNSLSSNNKICVPIKVIGYKEV